MVHIHPCGASHVRLGRRVIESNCSTWGNSCWCRSGHSPPWLRSWWSPWKKQFTVLAASAATAIPTRSSYRETVDGKESKIECAIVLYSHPLEIEVCERNVLSARVHSATQASPNQRRQFYLIWLPNPSRNWWLNRQRQWGWVSALSFYSSCLFRLPSLRWSSRVETVVGEACQRVGCTIFFRLPREACMELSTLKLWIGQACQSRFVQQLFVAPTWSVFDLARWFRIGAERVETVLVRPASVLNCTVTDCCFHVMLILALSDCADLDACFFLVFLGTARCWVRGSPADLPSASRTCPCWLCWLTFLASTCPPEKKIKKEKFKKTFLEKQTGFHHRPKHDITEHQHGLNRDQRYPHRNCFEKYMRKLVMNFFNKQTYAVYSR